MGHCPPGQILSRDLRHLIKPTLDATICLGPATFFPTLGLEIQAAQNDEGCKPTKIDGGKLFMQSVLKKGFFIAALATLAAPAFSQSTTPAPVVEQRKENSRTGLPTVWRADSSPQAKPQIWKRRNPR